MKKLIFLDIDGVMNSTSFYEKTENFVWGMFCPDAVRNLNQIVKETGAEIVISSAWRLHMMLDELQLIFNKNKVIPRIAYGTPRLQYKYYENKTKVPRGCEIKLMMEIYEVAEDYVIIDDDASGILLAQKDHFFQTDPDLGLTDDVRDKVIKYLNRNK